MIRRHSGTLFDNVKRAALGAALFLCAGAAQAEDVTLKSLAGELTLTGRVLDYDGTYLQLVSQHGPVTVLYDNVICEGVDCPGAGPYTPRIRLTAPPQMAEVLLPALIQRYATMHGLRARTEAGETGRLVLILEDDTKTLALFDVRAAPVDEGFADLVANEADIILSRREISSDEAQMATEARIAAFDTIGPTRIIGYDALIPVVAPSRALAALSMKELVQVYQGEIVDWADLGGRPGPIRLHMAHEPRDWGAPWGVTWHGDFETVVASVLADPAALGVVSFQNSGFAQQADLVDACGFVALPNQAAVKTQDYPLAVPLYLYRAQRRLPQSVSEFLEWLPTPQAQLVVRRSGFVDAGLLPIPLDAQGQRFLSAVEGAQDAQSLLELQSLTRAIAGRTRLSMSFRFRPGGIELDAASRAHLLRLTQIIEAGDFKDRSILFLGFSDGDGPEDRNKALSLRRASAVRDALLLQLGKEISELAVDVRGFGEALPIGCDDTPWGRHQNRRVELWVGD